MGSCFISIFGGFGSVGVAVCGITPAGAAAAVPGADAGVVVVVDGLTVGGADAAVPGADAGAGAGVACVGAVGTGRDSAGLVLEVLAAGLLGGCFAVSVLLGACFVF